MTQAGEDCEQENVASGFARSAHGGFRHCRAVSRPCRPEASLLSDGAHPGRSPVCFSHGVVQVKGPLVHEERDHLRRSKRAHHKHRD